MELAVGTAPSNLARCFSPHSPPYPSIHPVNPAVLRILPSSPNSRCHSLICCGKRGSGTKSPPKELALEEQEEAKGKEKEVEEVEKELEDETVEYIEDFGDDMLANDETDYDEDEFQDEEEEDADPQAGDGGGGGGISLSGTWWDKEALAIAEEVSLSFNGDLKIYAFKTAANSSIRLRIESMSNKYGSPTMDEIEAFSSAYRLRLDEAQVAGTIPKDIYLEVSSPGVDRIVRVPEELGRFKDRPMYVKYAAMDAETCSIQEADGVFTLIAFDHEAAHCTWGIADAKINRQKAGKGRPLSKKQRQWRLETPFDSLRLVRLHSDS